MPGSWKPLESLPSHASEGYRLVVPFNDNYPKQFTFYLIRYIEDEAKLTLGLGNYEKTLAYFDNKETTDSLLENADYFIGLLGQVFIGAVE